MDRGIVCGDAIQESGATPNVCGTPREGKDFIQDLRGVELDDRGLGLALYKTVE
jgi:hypothetical protein